VLEAAGEEELPFVQEAQVAGPQERPLAGVREARPEGLPALLGLFPVPLRRARAGEPDFPDLTGAAPGPLLRVGDDNLLVGGSLPTADEDQRPRLPGRGRLRPVGLQRCLADALCRRRAALLAAGGEERRLRQPVAGVEGLAPEPAGRERLCEALQGFG